MERELTRRCGRSVRVAEFVAADATSTIWTDEDVTERSFCKMPLFEGYVEVKYARQAWLSARVDIWSLGDACFRQVKSVSVYLQHNKKNLTVAMEKELTALQKVANISVTNGANQGELPALTSDELTQVLEELVQQVVDAFREQQVQALHAATSQRVKFEYEMLHDYPGLDILVLACASFGRFVSFAIPLLDQKRQWDPKRVFKTENANLVYVPDGFETPNFAIATDNVTLCIEFSMDRNSDSDKLRPLLIEWPARMKLSSQVTQMLPSSRAQSCVELVSSCKKMLLQQWKRRKDFIANLRQYVIVLEYDVVDFSHVSFMLQEQLNEQEPLRIIVLQLQFTAAYYITNCTSDLHVTLLDGDARAEAVTIPLAVSCSDHDPAINSSIGVAQFLELVRQSLLQRFYHQ
ncbi:hypothetical protein CCR75_004847 [Bremia lactucae]|uniref:Uncharacterized protein n=1 Tax=Bremia lactucae TaxID=4779 RepID=A0A976FIJ8_BRELC|nr:hypothetical protein CCR75_004847 [Bremia lactucae]